MEIANELWECQDCLQIAALDADGTCQTCGSAAVFPERLLASEAAA